jgi:hypothetical protein
MTKITGRFKRAEETGANGKTSTVWAAGAKVTISLLDGQEVALSRGGPVLEEFPTTTIVLDDEGRIPEGTEIIGNDVLWPEGTCYEISIDDEWANSLADLYGYATIEGTEVDLSAFELNPFHAGARPAYRPSPVPFPTPAPTRRTLPSSRKAGVNYRGFYAVTINPPSMTGTCTTPDISRSTNAFQKAGEFCVTAFTLPISAVIGCASIKIETAQLGHRVLIGLYDYAGARVCSAEISTDKPDVATGELEREFTLKPGEYFLGWAGSRDIRLRSIGENQGQFDLGNVGGGGVSLGTIGVPMETTELPERIDLTRINPCHSFVPPMVYFKS